MLQDGCMLRGLALARDNSFTHIDFDFLLISLESNPFSSLAS